VSFFSLRELPRKTSVFLVKEPEMNKTPSLPNENINKINRIDRPDQNPVHPVHPVRQPLLETENL
jgi:hypothetical protein